MTCVCDVDESLEGLASELVLETVAVLDRSSVRLVGLTTIVMWAVPLKAIAPRSQVTVEVPEHEPWSEFADTNSTPLGSGSVTCTPAAASGPSFATVIEYVSS